MMRHLSLCSWKMIIFTSFFSGPLGAAYLMHHNFKTLGYDEAADKCLLFGMISLLFFLNLFLFFPVFFILIFIVLVLNFFIIFYLYKRYQENFVQVGFASGVKHYSLWKLVIVNFSALAITIFFWNLLALFSQSFS